MTLYLLNALIIPFKDDKAYFLVRKISVEEAKKILEAHNNEFTSAIGHMSTADALSLLLGIKIPTNRVEVYFEVGDEAIALSLRKRLLEGQVLRTIEEVQRIGFDLYYVKRLA